MPKLQPLTRRSALGLALGSSAAGLWPALAQVRTRLTIATAGKGSAFLPFGEALAAVVPKHAPLDIAVRETKGSNENADLVSRGEVELATLNMGPGYDAWTGQGPFAGRQLRGMRAIAPMYETPFHTLALRESGIARLRDLAGKRVGVGPAGGPGEVFFKGLAEALGIQATIVTGTPAELGAAVLAKSIDAFWYGSGIPSPPFVEAAGKADAVVFGFQPDEAEAFRTRFPYFAPYQIAVATYKGQAGPLSSMAVWNFVVANEKVADEAAYQLTKGLLERVGEISAIFRTASAMTIENAGANTFMPFHDGAVRYYRERGTAHPTISGR